MGKKRYYTLLILLVLMSNSFYIRAQEKFPLKITDQFQRDITIKEKPTRIISTSPTNTEILFALGLAERVVGVTNWCDYPPEVKEKEKIGNIIPLNREKILSLRPDLIISSDINGKESVESLEELGLPIVVVNPTNITKSLKAIEVIGQVTGKDTEAADLVKKIETFISEIRKKGEKNNSKKLKVLVIVGDELGGQPLWTAGSGTFLDEAITLTGGYNIAHDMGFHWGQISIESVLKHNPDVIITAIDAKKFYQDDLWEGISAVEKKQVYKINVNVFSRPGPRLITALEELMLLMEDSKGL